VLRSTRLLVKGFPLLLGLNLASDVPWSNLSVLKPVVSDGRKSSLAESKTRVTYPAGVMSLQLH
jgi:hypothetical protein